MFGFKQNIKKELNEIWKAIETNKNRLDIAFNERKALETNSTDTITKLNKIQEEIENLVKFKETIKKAIPTFNKIIESQNEMNKYINMSTKLFMRIIKHIKLPKVEKKEQWLNNQNKGK